MFDTVHVMFCSWGGGIVGYVACQFVIRYPEDGDRKSVS